MISLVIPAFSAGPDLKRTIESCNGICDESIVISTAFFPEDEEVMRRAATKLICLPWNFVFIRGFGELYNQATDLARNDWLMLLGVAETLAEPYADIHKTLAESDPAIKYRCDHVNDPNTWKRVWNRQSGNRWSGLIHEEIVGGTQGPVLFRMQDTNKTPRASEFETEVCRYLKNVSYQNSYLLLLENPHMIGGTHPNWLKCLNDTREQLEEFKRNHADLLYCARAGDRKGFRDGVKRRFESGQRAAGCDYDPTGSPASTSTHIVPLPV